MHVPTASRRCASASRCGCCSCTRGHAAASDPIRSRRSRPVGWTAAGRSRSGLFRLVGVPAGDEPAASVRPRVRLASRAPDPARLLGVRPRDLGHRGFVVHRRGLEPVRDRRCDRLVGICLKPDGLREWIALDAPRRTRLLRRPGFLPRRSLSIVLPALAVFAFGAGSDRRAGFDRLAVADRRVPGRIGAGGKLIFGAAGSERGPRGFVMAYTPDLKPAWPTPFWTIPPDRQSWRRASRIIGGGPVWTPVTIDSKTNTVFFGTGSGTPVYFPSMRPGNNPRAASLIAVDLATGKLKWWQQLIQNDQWEYDVAQPPRRLRRQGRRQGAPDRLRRDQGRHVVRLRRRHRQGVPRPRQGARPRRASAAEGRASRSSSIPARSAASTTRPRPTTRSRTTSTTRRPRRRGCWSRRS